MDNTKYNDSDVTVTDEGLEAAGYRKYRGTEMDIYWSKDICQHAAECVRGNPEVWNVDRKPWIMPDNGTKAYNQEVIQRCPSGALKFIPDVLDEEMNEQ